MNEKANGRRWKTENGNPYRGCLMLSIESNSISDYYLVADEDAVKYNCLSIYNKIRISLSSREPSCNVKYYTNAQNSIFSTQGTVFIDQLNLSIKEKRSYIKSAEGYLEDLRVKLYETKFLKYQKILQNEEALGLDSKYDPHFLTDPTTIRRFYKTSLLKELCLVLQDLIHERKPENKRKLAALEFKFRKEYVAASFALPVWLEYIKVATSLEKVREDLRLELAARGLHLKIRLKTAGRDLRQCYRNLVRSIFKNMDDQSGDDDLVSKCLLQEQIILTPNLSKDVRSRQLRAFEIHFKRE